MVAATAYEPVIGLEVHVQLQTKSKMFCGCSAAYAGAEPNTHVCPVCMALPGVLPVINRQAVEYAFMAGLALNCEIPEASKFDRKNYPYPDLVKGYQISQYDRPFNVNGWIDIDVDGETRRIGITRAHLEEDTAKLTHKRERGSLRSLVDLNRAGVPLLEIVSEPDIRSPAEGRAYLQKLRLTVQTLGVSTGNMEEGAMRCDVNVSLRPVGTERFGTKVEVKNLNSARSVQRALEYEMIRQAEVLERGERVAQETRGWDDDRGITVSQRSKEDAHDYRYFPEPDLPPIFVGREWVDELRARLPELPDARRERYMRDFGLSHYDAVQLTSSLGTSTYFESVIARYANPKIVANWIQGELFRVARSLNVEVEGTRVTPDHLAELLTLVDDGTVSQAMAKGILEEVAQSGQPPKALIAERGLAQISDTSELDRAVAEAIAANPQAAADYKAGKTSAMGFLTGQVMKATRGKANPGVVNDLLKRQLDRI
ncbi:MAG: aspartyl-tRNA(Asn)/glutamyl-tRNA(Gln) amidotransferase subunit [Chloroflexota bacterium]|jgi:aspartyl-tRNA(Asn)/glutamyl-tRNA(Gln) amidotransferase subunit B|nr:aspartyl-tRNA(Asn)/glutamyl-tRNA(Gln) amidotransferase subunit [Chloroflexota bacterium]